MKRYGDDAALAAARRPDKLLAAGGPEDCTVWKRILEAVAELTRTERAKGERMN